MAYNRIIKIPKTVTLYLLCALFLEYFVRVSVADLQAEEFVMEYKKLKSDIFSNYPKLMDNETTFPPPKGSQLIKENRQFFSEELYAVLTKVKVLVSTKRIVEMEIEQQSLVLVVEELTSWTDPSLSWKQRYNETHNDYLNSSAMITSMLFNSKKVWMPPIYAKNVLQEQVIRDWTEVHVWSSGTCQSKRTVQYTIPCTVSVKNFPFDIHNCSLLLSQPLHWHSRLSFEALADNKMRKDVGDKHVYNHQGEHLLWQLIEWNNTVTKHEDIDEIEEFTYTLILRRRATFYFTVLVVPCIVLNLLSLSIFTLPVADNGRMDFCLALILTYFVLIMIVVESVPPSGEEIPLLGLYIILSAVAVAKGFGMSMFLVQIDKQRAKKKVMSKSLSNLLVKWCGLRRKSIVKKLHQQSIKLRKVIATEAENAIIENGSGGSNGDNWSNIESYKWEYLGKVLNILFCILNILTHIIIPIFLFL